MEDKLRVGVDLAGGVRDRQGGGLAGAGRAVPIEKLVGYLRRRIRGPVSGYRGTVAEVEQPARDVVVRVGAARAAEGVGDPAGRVELDLLAGHDSLDTRLIVRPAAEEANEPVPKVRGGTAPG